MEPRLTEVVAQLEEENARLRRHLEAVLAHVLGTKPAEQDHPRNRLQSIYCVAWQALHTQEDL